MNDRPSESSSLTRGDPHDPDLKIHMEHVEITTDEKTDQLVVEIEQTRTDLSGTIDAIQERLNPQVLKEEAKSLITDATDAVKDEAKSLMNDATDAVRDATIGKVERMASTATSAAKETGNSIFGTIAANPIPSALIGIGLGWLFMNRRSASHSSNRYEIERSNRFAADYSGAYQPYDAPNDRSVNESRGITDKVSDTASSVAGKVSDTAGNVADTVSSKASDVAELAGDLAEQAKAKTSSALHLTQQRVSQLPENVQDMVQSNPLVVAGTAIALGAAIGLLLPETQAEHRMMGETRDQFMDQTKGFVKETKEKVQHVAEDVAHGAQDTIKEKAREENLIPQSQPSSPSSAQSQPWSAQTR